MLLRSLLLSLFSNSITLLSVRQCWWFRSTQRAPIRVWPKRRLMSLERCLQLTLVLTQTLRTNAAHGYADCARVHPEACWPPLSPKVRKGSIILSNILRFSKWRHSQITMQPKTGCPLNLSRVEPGQYLDGRPPGKTRLLLEEVLMRPAGGAHLWSVWVPTPQYRDRDSILWKSTVFRMRR